MPFTILLFITRNPALTPTDFKTHWDTVHIPLLQSIAGADFPVSHTRRYIARPEEVKEEEQEKEEEEGTQSDQIQAGLGNKTWPAVVMVGAQEDFTYDGIAELQFADEQHFQRFYAKVSEPENAAKIAADEERFIVREGPMGMRAVGVGGMSVTRRE